MPRPRPHPFGCATADLIAGLAGLDLVLADAASEQRTQLRELVALSSDAVAEG